MHSRGAKGTKDPGLYKRVFCYRNKGTVLSLYKALVRPLPEYGAQFWSLVRRINVEHLEKGQARVTKLVPSICHKEYQRRLADLGLFTLEQRRLRACSLKPLRSLEISVGWTRLPCLNCLVTARGTTVLGWCRPGSTPFSTGISQGSALGLALLEMASGGGRWFAAAFECLVRELKLLGDGSIVSP